MGRVEVCRMMGYIIVALYLIIGAVVWSCLAVSKRGEEGR